MSIRYMETSALLTALLEHDSDARRKLRAAGRQVTSALTVAESYRATSYARAAGRLDATQEQVVVRALSTFFARCDLIAVTDEVLTRTSHPFPAEPIRTLDAIHLATADFLGDSPPLVTIVTRDARV